MLSFHEETLDKILAVVRAGRPQPQYNVPSPRGVAEFQYGVRTRKNVAWKSVRLFSPEQAETIVLDLCGWFLEDIVSRTLTVMAYSCNLRVKPAHVAKALENFVSAEDIPNRGYLELDLSKMDEDNSSDYDGSDMEDEGEELFVNEDAVTFSDLYPPVENIRLSDKRFLREVALPYIEENFRMSPTISATAAGMWKQAMYAYATAKLSCYYNDTFDQLEEAAFLLELAIWKVHIDQSDAATADEREQCRMNSGAEIVVSNVLPYLCYCEHVKYSPLVKQALVLNIDGFGRF